MSKIKSNSCSSNILKFNKSIFRRNIYWYVYTLCLIKRLRITGTEYVVIRSYISMHYLLGNDKPLISFNIIWWFYLDEQLWECQIKKKTVWCNLKDRKDFRTYGFCKRLSGTSLWQRVFRKFRAKHNDWHDMQSSMFAERKCHEYFEINVGQGSAYVAAVMNNRLFILISDRNNCC